MRVTVQGKSVLIDEEDISLFMRHNWRINSQGYVVTYSRQIFLHRLIAEFSQVKRIIGGTRCKAHRQNVCFKNGNKLDCRKKNLRIGGHKLKWVTDRINKQKWRNSHPEKAYAQGVISRLIGSGKLIKQPCAICGEPRTEAHHSNYQKVYDIIWLCRNHHLKQHNLLSKT